ncbi:MAG: hypothetical protein IPQ21_22385 [Betaproteobacteria bacterium]|nr:hypothetical protein [Betaproteobacteria bacterium]
MKIGHRVEQIGIQIDVAGLGCLQVRSPDGSRHCRPAEGPAAPRMQARSYAVTPGPLLPGARASAPALLERGDAGRALREFDAVLWPRNPTVCGRWSACAAAERAGDAQKARDYADRVSRQTAQADAGVPG